MSNPTAADYARVDAEHDSMPNEWRHRAARAVAALRAELDAERAAHAETKARLALAEAVCESCDVCDSFGVSGQRYDAKALAAWRAAK